MVDPVLASRLQFALTTIVHIVFPVVSMGLAPFLVYFTYEDLWGDDVVYARLRTFWTKVFAVSFVAGTVTGLVLEFEFGTNWGAFSTFAGQLFGGPLAIEGMMAFFLEATFLGVFLFGRERVGKRGYFASACLVAVGSWLSATWILDANSWMQNPQGYRVVTQNGNRVVRLVDPIAAYLNPRFPWMLFHMQNAAVISVALGIAGVAAYYVRYRDGADDPFWRTSLKTSLVALLITAPLQVVQGDTYARHIVQTQPHKFAAMEAVYHTESYVPEYLFAFPTSVQGFFNPRTKELFGLGIPGGASWLASGGNAHATIQGLDSFAGGSPPVAAVFWSFRIMVGLGFWFVVLAFWAGYRWRTGELYEDHLLHRALMLSSVLGFVALETGWVVTEVGRQPWVVQGLLKTQNAVTTSLTGTEATLTLAGFVVGYALLLVVYGYVLYRIFREGPPDADEVDGHGSGSETPGDGAVAADGGRR